jgi:ethanolamine ammonia-lyase small subunit
LASALPWGALKRFTDARVALGRAGNGLPTAAHLAFQAAHAAARDEVWKALDVAALGRALAAEAVKLLSRVGPALAREGVAIAPIVIAEHGRVALGDAVGAALGAEAVAVLIGERPGLSAPRSMGVYLTWAPRPGRTDAERNCISNIRPGGLSGEAAAETLLWLIGEMRRRRVTGVELKDERPGALPLEPHWGLEAPDPQTL